MDGARQLPYSENLSYGGEEPTSAHAQSLCEVGDARHHGASPQETSVVHRLSRQSTEGSLEMEAAFNNRGLEDSYATDSSSVWSPEASDLFSILFLLQCFVLCLVLALLPSPTPKKKILQKESIFLNKDLKSLYLNKLLFR